MSINFCYQPLSGEKTERNCSLSVLQPFLCCYNSNHVHFQEDEHSIEDAYNETELNESLQAIIVQIGEKIADLLKIKFMLHTYQDTKYFVELLNNISLKVEEHGSLLMQLRIDAKYSKSIEGFPISLAEFIAIIKNIEIEIEIFEKITKILLLENKLKNYWLAKILESPEKIEELKSEFNSEIKDIEAWCFQHPNSWNSQIINPINKLMLISELIQNNFEAKHFFLVYRNCVIIYGAESWIKNKFCIQHKIVENYEGLPSIELPNCKIFCILGNKYPCIIDLKTMRISKMFPNPCAGNQFSFVYYENSVFVFSSLSTDFKMNCLEKYDLIRGLKRKMPKNLIHSSKSFYCAIYRNSILFCVKDSSAFFKFDLLTYSYSYLPISGLSSLSAKLLFTGKNRAYVIDTKSGIFESQIDNECIWNQISAYKKYDYAEGIYASLANSSYFSTFKRDGMNIYKFDLNSKKLYEIKYSYS